MLQQVLISFQHFSMPRVIAYIISAEGHGKLDRLRNEPRTWDMPTANDLLYQ